MCYLSLEIDYQGEEAHSCTLKRVSQLNMSILIAQIGYDYRSISVNAEKSKLEMETNE